MILTDETYTQKCAEAGNLGTDRGESDARAAWPSVTPEQVRYLARNESVPASLYGNRPGPLSGEWFGDPTAAAVLTDLGLTDRIDEFAEDDILRAYEEAYEEAYEDELVALAVDETGQED